MRQNKIAIKPGSTRRSNAGNSLLSGSVLPASGGSRMSAGKDLFGHSDVNVGRQASPIHFGHPSQSGQVSKAGSGSLWEQLIPHSASGVSKLLRGGVLGAVGQLLFSGLGDLFGGGKSAPPPLVRFSLPDSKNTTLEVNQNSATGASGVTSPFANPTQYSNPNAQVVQAVREALLTSSQLNDVISEL